MMFRIIYTKLFNMFTKGTATSLNVLKLVKVLTLILVTSIWNNIFGQNDSVARSIIERRKPLNCSSQAQQLTDKISDYFYSNEIDSINIVASAFKIGCGNTEWLRRVEVLISIIRREKSDDLILNYFIDGHDDRYRTRLKMADYEDFGLWYENSDKYFGYLPLRSELDSIVMNISNNLLNEPDLTTDERLVLLLFGGNIVQFELEMKRKSSKNSRLIQYEAKSIRESKNSYPATVLYSGIITPIGNKQIYSTSPVLGVGFSSSLQRNLVFDIILNFTINTNNKHFDFYAMGDTNWVKSDVTVMFGVTTGFKLVEKKNLTLMARFGAGVVSADTGLSETKPGKDEKKYYSVTTFYASGSVMALVPVFKRNYLGVELGWYYCPYQLDKRLLTRFDNHSVSTQLFFRF